MIEINSNRLPEWFRRPLGSRSALGTREILDRHQLNTVCESAHCPNQNECYSRATATFMILGNACTRSCGFCAVPAGKGEPVRLDEPEHVARAAKELGLRYVVVTSVARDDLRDEGAGHFAQTVQALKLLIPGVQVEVLTPDFHARRELIEKVVQARPHVYNHNLETVERLQQAVRVQGRWERSLTVLKTVKTLYQGLLTKSGLMLGLGETDEEVIEAARALREVGCDILTLGQYLAPGRDYLKVERFVSPKHFQALAGEIRELGFLHVFAGPYVRSSYHAGEAYHLATQGAF